VDQGDPAHPGRTDPAVRVREERDRHGVARLRLLGRLDSAGDHVEIGSVFLLGMGSIVLGLPIMFLIARRQEQKPFFRGESLHHDTPVLVPE